MKKGMEGLMEILNAATAEREKEGVVSCNQKTEKYGLLLSEKEALELISSKNESLKKEQRIEMGEGVLKRLIELFCDSGYLQQDTYAETLARLQDTFYEFKNESMDLLADDELLHFMREQFEDVCMGDMDYLEGTCLERFSRAIRAGYSGYQKSGGYGEYGQFREEQGLNRELYLMALEDLL